MKARVMFDIVSSKWQDIDSSVDRWPSVAAGFASAGSTNYGSEILGRKIPKSFKKENLNLSCAKYYTESV